MAQRQDVLNKHTQQGLQMKLAYLETLIKRAEASKDRRLQEQLQAEADKTLLLINGANLDTPNPAGNPEGAEVPGATEPGAWNEAAYADDPARQAMEKARRLSKLHSDSSFF